MGEDADPAALVDATASFLDDRENGEPVLETLLSLEADRETWTFEDAPLDSGTFGEVVSRGIVERVDDEYRVADPEVVGAVLAGEPANCEDDESGAVEFRVDARAAASLSAALALLFLLRILNYRSVFRGGRVVSPGNDPYFYRYWMEELLAATDGVTDYGTVVERLDGAGSTRPLTHASNWLLAELLGGDRWAAEVVAAWLPVAATLVLGALVYWLAVIVADDVRVGLASVLLLALTPVHAVYSGLGFLEHRLHQYLWLGATLVALAWLATDLRRRREVASTTRAAIRGHLTCRWTPLAAVALGAALAFSALAWGGSILLFVPAAAYVGMKAAMDARHDVSPVLANAPVLAGLAVAAALSALAHVRWGWHEPFLVSVPPFVLAGAVGATALGECWRRFEWPAVGLVVLQGVLVGASAFAFRRLRPADWARLHARADDLLFRERYTESVSLFAPDLGVVFGPLVQLGVGFYVALVALGWACWVASRRYEPAWLLLAVYTIFWLVMAAIQVRFAAQLAISFAVLGGLGLVHLLAWVDLARVPAPLRNDERGDGALDRGDGASGRNRRPGDDAATDPSVVPPGSVRSAAYLVGIVLLVCGASLLYVPTLGAQTAYDDAQFGAATAIEAHAATTDREYPETYVLSHWPDNRMYNYFVNGEARSYAYADGTFERFRSDSDPDRWYDQFENRVGYVVLTDVNGGLSANSVQVRLHENLGTGDEETAPLSHYRAVYVDDDATAFAVVPGATIEGTGEPGERFTIGTTVEVTGETVTYERRVVVEADGTFSVTVPYPGTYDGDGVEVTVSEDDVLEGATVELE